MTSTNKNSNDSAAAAAATTSPTTTAYQTIEDLIGPTLYVKQPKKPSPAATENDGVEYTIVSCTTQSVLTKKNKPVEYVLLYFSASWCPPCQSFTPILADFYQRYPDQMEIIYISSDRNVTEFTKYYTSKMEFSTIHPFDATASDVTTTLRKQFVG
jgi:thiol-disulfide isomerase/thioredoxin